MLDTAHEVATPEGIELRLRPAGPLARVRAWEIDLLIRLALGLGLSMGLSALGMFGAGLMFLVIFFLEWLYPVLFEVYFDGMTPGKRAVGLMVLHDDGTPVRWAASLVRNLLRFVDFMPFLYGFGLAAMLMNRDFKRIGDLAAGTVVVYRDGTASQSAIPPAEPAPPRVPLAPRDQRTVIEFAGRTGTLTEERAEELAALVPGVTGTSDGRQALARLLAMANYLVGRRA